MRSEFYGGIWMPCKATTAAAVTESALTVERIVSVIMAFVTQSHMIPTTWFTR